MSAPMLAGLAAIAAAALFVIVAATIVALRGVKLARRASLLQSHPTVRAARTAGEIGQTVSGLGARAGLAARRLHAVSASLAELGSAVAIIGLNVDRVAFATRLLLETVFSS